LGRTAEYLKQTVDFAVDATLSGAGRLELIHRAKACGYEVFLAFAALNNPERNIARVRDRVAKGGHFVPEGDVRRRYMRSLETCLKRSVWQTRPNSMTTPVTVYASSSSPGAAS
jgi:predicted ABC-type ATPase